MKTRSRNISGLLAVTFLLLTALATVSCEKPEQPYDQGRNVFIYYAAGHNSLASFIKSDFQELTENYLPGKRKDNNVVLIFCRLTDYAAYPEGAPAHLFRLYRRPDGSPQLETLLTLRPELNAADPETMEKVLRFIRKKYPRHRYGMLFSSHATGWLPTGYYGHEHDFEAGGDIWQRGRQKSIGQDAVGKESYEMELKAFADAFPMHLDYLLFDCCLMGGVECAWELREVADKIGFSQTEILADGFNYKKIIENLFKNPEYGPERICRDYFEQYESKTGWEQSATISLVRTSRLTPLAQTCGKLTEKYRSSLERMDRKAVQRYFRDNHDYFFDLKDIFIKAGASAAETDELQAALDACIIYKAATKEFMLSQNGFKIGTYSGLSMYLPSNQKPYLNDHYRTLDWNIVSGLVK